MLCTTCVSNKYGFADPKCSFVQGSTPFYLPSIKIHEDSKKHNREQEAHIVGTTPSTSPPAEKMLAKIGER